MTPAAPIIGLDVGTTGVKAVAFWPGTGRRLEALREYPLLSPEPAEEVQDPLNLLGAVRAALSECVSGLQGAGVAAISLSTAMHGLIGLAADRTPTTPLVTWADGRAWREAQELIDSTAGQVLRATTGAPLHPMTPLAKLLWYSRHEPGVWRATRWWVDLKAYLLLSLTGTLTTELSSASATGLLDINSRTWSLTALDLCQLDADRLPGIVSPTEVLSLTASAAASVGLASGTPVVAGAADGPLANVGTGAIAPGVAALSLGTSGAVRTTVDRPILDGTGSLFCYALTETLWVVGGAMSNGAAVVRWAAQALVPDLTDHVEPSSVDAAVLGLAGQVAPGSDGLVMLPFLLPERAPMWSPDISGAYLGLQRSHTRAHMVRAAVEGVCLHMARILERVAAVEPVNSVRATGGAFRSELWRQVMAAAVRPPLHVLDGSEGTALGAAALGLHALHPSVGLGDALQQLGVSPVPPPRTEPRPDMVAGLDRARARTLVMLQALERGVGPLGR